MRSKRKILVVEYDVTGLTAKQIESLTLEAVVQGEPSDGHPNAPVIDTKVVARGKK